ncbi:ENTPD1 (predicted) [Pycnogonum litorale]
MPNICVIVQSTFSGRASGFQAVTVNSSDKVDSIILAYCAARNIEHQPYYILRTAKNIPLDNEKKITSCKLEDGDTVFLGSKEDEDVMFSFNNWWAVSFIALMIGGIGIVSISLVYFLDVPTIPNNYAVIFDAGSTHTMAYVYKWCSKSVNGTGILTQLDSCKGKKNGLSSFKSDPDDAGSSISGCLKSVKSKIPKDDRSSSFVFLGATAGMRLVRILDRADAIVIMISVNNTLRNSGLLHGGVSIIEGSDEAKYAWVAVNYLLMNFRNFRHTSGSLDLGGASTQIAYETRSLSRYNSFVQLFKKNHTVYTRSYLCYGMKQIRLRHLASLIKDPKSNATTFDDPCAPKGHSRVMSFKDLFSTPCTQTTGINNLIQSIPKNKSFTFNGQSNPTECAKRINLLFNQTACNERYSRSLCFEKPSDFEHSKFLALTGFEYTSKFLNVTDVSLDRYERTIREFCSKSWQQLKPYHRNKFLSTYCFDGQYVHRLLVEGYGFNTTYWSNVKFVDSIEDTDVGWALGYMLDKTSHLAMKKPEDIPLSLTIFCILIALFVIFLLLSVAFGCHALKQRKYHQTYQRFDSTYKTLENVSC